MTAPFDTLILPPRLFGSIYYYALLAARSAAAKVWIGMPFDKRQKTAHRYTIVDTRDTLSLTVPIIHPHGGKRPWSDIEISAHGEWWLQHLTALESAYGRTPYFEFYIDRFTPLYRNPQLDGCSALGELIMGSNAILADILCIEPPQYVADADYTAVKTDSEIALSCRDVAYWQVRADRLGFRPGLSILDLIFNKGPESIFVLESMVSATPQP